MLSSGSETSAAASLGATYNVTDTVASSARRPDDVGDSAGAAEAK